MDIWEIKQNINTCIKNIVMEDDFKKRLDITFKISKLQDMLTEKIIKMQVELEYQLEGKNEFIKRG